MVVKTINVNELSEDLIAHYFPMLTDAKKEKIIALSDAFQRSVALCSEMLARQCLSVLCDAPEFAFSLLCNPNSKSVVGNFDANLSISRLEDVIVCAASYNSVGTGISRIEPFTFKQAQDNLTDSEIRTVFSESVYSFGDIVRKNICEEDAPMIKYAVYQSLKEAHFMASGRGIRSDRKKISFQFRNNEMLCSDENFTVSKSFVDNNERIAISVIERCKL